MAVAKALVDGQKIEDGMDLPGFGKIQLSETDPTTVIMAAPIRFTKENIDEFDFGI